MNLREAITRRVHGVLCRPGRIPEVNWGCCGCGGPEMDAYLTVGCDWCKAPGESFCWTCLDVEEFPWWNGITLADFTVLPGRERAS